MTISAWAYFDSHIYLMAHSQVAQGTFSEKSGKEYQIPPVVYDVFIWYNMLFGESESSWDISWSFIDKSLSENKIIQRIVTQEGASSGDIWF